MRNVLMAVLVAATMTIGQVPMNGLVARYDFTGGSLQDLSGNNRTLRWYEIATTMPELCTDRDGNPNNAYHWQGDIDLGLVGSDTGLPMGSSDRSICLWIAVTSWDTCMQIVSWSAPLIGDRNREGSFRVVAKADTFCIQQGATRVAKYEAESSYFPAHGSYNNPWVHLALVVSGTTAKWYLNGNLKSTITIPALQTTVLQTGSFLTVGASPYRILHAKMDDVLIYNRALSDGEVRGIVYPTHVKTTNTYTHKNVTSYHAQLTCLLDGRVITQRSKEQLFSIKAVR